MSLCRLWTCVPSVTSTVLFASETGVLSLWYCCRKGSDMWYPVQITTWWIPVSSRPSLRTTRPGIGSRTSLSCVFSGGWHSKAWISPAIRVALGGRRVVGRSKTPPLETWYIFFASVPISRAISVDETPAPIRRTFCQPVWISVFLK